MRESVGFGRINIDAFSDELLKISEDRKHHIWHGSEVDYKPHLSEDEQRFIREHLPHAEERMHYQTPGAAKGAIAGGILAGLPTALAVGAMVGAQHGLSKGFAAGLVGLGVGTAVGAALGAMGARKPSEKDTHAEARELLQEAGKHKPVDHIQKLAALELAFFKQADLASREYMRKVLDEAPSIKVVKGPLHRRISHGAGELMNRLGPLGEYKGPAIAGAITGGLAGHRLSRGEETGTRAKATAAGAGVGALTGAAILAALKLKRPMAA
jgi:hypothetical protein